MTRFLPRAILLAMLVASSAQAQNLRLFEPVEGEGGDQNMVPVQPDQVFVQQGNGQPAYTLRSISRFGDQYQAVLLDRNGGVSRVSWTAGTPAPVPNSAFAVVGSTPGSLSLQHPPSDPCVNSMQQGVFCSSSNQSELRLVPATPLASNGVVMGPTVAGAGANGMQTVQGVQMQQGANGFFQGAAQGDNPFADATVNANGQQVFINPFSGQPEVMQQLSPEEQMQRDQRQQLRAARLRAFGQSQIEDEAIPPGMQRVRTPFGDRLMPVRE